MHVEEVDVVVGSTVGVDHFNSIWPRVLAQAEKLNSMPHGVRGFKDGVLQQYTCLAFKVNSESS
jgi:hypothetical protein